MNPQYPNTMPQQPAPDYRGPHQQPVRPQPRGGLWQVPKAFWVGLVVAGGSFFVHVSVQQTSVGSGGYSCSYTDFFGFVAAAVIGLCVVTGWVTRAASHVNARLAVPLMAAFTVALLALAVVHALRGNGTILSPCDAQPLP